MIKYNDLLADHIIKKRFGNYCSNINMKTMFMNTAKQMNHRNVFLTCHKKVRLNMLFFITCLFITRRKI